MITAFSILLVSSANHGYHYQFDSNNRVY